MHGWSSCMFSLLWWVRLKMRRALSLGSDIQHGHSHVHYCWVVITIWTMPYLLRMHEITCQVTYYSWYGLRLPCSIQQKQYSILDITHRHCNAINISSILVLLYTHCICAVNARYPWWYTSILAVHLHVIEFPWRMYIFPRNASVSNDILWGKLHLTKWERCEFGSYTIMKKLKV